MTAADEQQLILHAKEGSHDAFRVLVERYMKQAYNIAYGFVNDHDDAEDIAQEAFVRVFRSIKTFRGDAEFATWLYRIVTNVSFNRTRQKKNIARREVQLVNETLETMGSATPEYSHDDVEAIMERALHELPTLQRATVILRHLNGMSTRQVSNVLRCSEGTVKTHLHRGLKKMKKMMIFLREQK
ncbi:MAG: RNA polymerase sigma factor [Ignavibacteria bacterium]|nr:RNA polymerase sigma factor [Ignavibacteria bacterium]